MKPDQLDNLEKILSPINPAETEGQTIQKRYTLSSDDQYRIALTPTSHPVWIFKQDDGIIASAQSPSTQEIVAYLPPLTVNTVGDPTFKTMYNTQYCYYAGAMANAISSEEMIISLGHAGLMGSFGSGGLLPERIEQAIQKIQSDLGSKPYAFNLLNSPNEPALEHKAVELFIRYQIPVVEASAYIALTPNLVWYRVSGLHRQPDGTILSDHHVIGKVSRKEVAKQFLEPAPADIVQRLVEEGKITREQADLSQEIAMADDITVEADSGGHTDNRPLVSVFPAILNLRDEIQALNPYRTPVRIGAAGGIATPESALAAFMMGAAYITTGSVNQSCIESGTSDHTRSLLAQAEMTDVTMAPASDMFEMGVKVQVLKRGTMFAMRAQKLYELYSRYDSLESIPFAEREKQEKTVFKMTFEEVWNACEVFFSQRDPRQIERANQNPKDKMALVFRWYLGLSSRWSNKGEVGREMDYQIWCGPAMGAFNDWVKGSSLEMAANRKVVDVAREILQGAAYLYRVRSVENSGISIPAKFRRYKPN